MTLYAKYIEEREGKKIIEDEYGFATYYFEPDWVYIEDLYVVPEKRKTGIASSYADKVAIEAKELGYTKMLGSVCLDANKSTQSLKVLLAYGFELYALKNNTLYLIKDISGENHG